MDHTRPAKPQCAITCGHCNADVPQKKGRGRLRLFCTPEHGRSYRRRMRATGFPI